MARILALDYGSKRTGLAVSDPLQIIASPLETVPTHQLMDYLVQYFSKEEVACLLVGQPTHKDGSETPLEGHIRGFLKRLSKQYPNLTIARINENYTSVQAEALIRESVFKRKDRQDKGLIDQMSAYVMLREYMDIY